MTYGDGAYQVYRADYPITQLLREVRPHENKIVLGHSRLITNGMSDNQPVVRDGICVIHNGIIVNDKEIWPEIGKSQLQQVVPEVIAGIASAYFEGGATVEQLPPSILELCVGVVACALFIPNLGKLCLFSNNGSLYLGEKTSRSSSHLRIFH